MRNRNELLVWLAVGLLLGWLLDPARGQVVWQSVPTQCYCGTCGPSGCCPPIYSQPRYAPPRPQQQRPEPDGEFTQPAPQFQPLPPVQPQVPAMPPQAKPESKPEFDFDAYSKKVDAAHEKLLEAIKANKCECKPCECKPTDLTPVINKLNALIEASKKPTPVPPPAPQPSAEQHVVVVANHNAPYWERLAQTLANTRKTYAGLQDTTPPPFEVGILPKAVVYRNNIPVRIVTGEHDVENLLYRLGRGEPI